MNGQIDIYDWLYAPYKINKPIRLIELFAGIGSQAMALRSIGADFEHYKIVEFDKYATASYNAIHGTDFEPIDITKIGGDDLEIKDVIDYTYIMTYSFPCTDLSAAGLMKGMAEGSGTRSSLLWEVRRLLEETENLPQVLIMENVPQIHSKANMPHFQKWLNYLEGKGYSNYWQDMNASDYGIPQSRKRTICVSILGYYSYKFPEKYPLYKPMDCYLEEEVDEKFYITNDKAWDLIDQLVKSGKIDEKCDKLINYAMSSREFRERPEFKEMRPSLRARDYKDPLITITCKVLGQMDNTQDHTFESANRVYDPSGISPTIPTCSGGNIQPKVLTICAMRGRNPDNPKSRKTGIPTEQMLEPNMQGIANTITTVQNDNLLLEIEPSSELNRWVWKINEIMYLIRIRKLTPKECWRLMDFTDADFDKAEAVNSNTQLYKQAGNSIVKNVLCEVFKALIN